MAGRADVRAELVEGLRELGGKVTGAPETLKKKTAEIKETVGEKAADLKERARFVAADLKERARFVGKTPVADFFALLFLVVGLLIMGGGGLYEVGQNSKMGAVWPYTTGTILLTCALLTGLFANFRSHFVFFTALTIVLCACAVPPLLSFLRLPPHVQELSAELQQDNKRIDGKVEGIQPMDRNWLMALSIVAFLASLFGVAYIKLQKVAPASPIWLRLSQPSSTTPRSAASRRPTLPI